MRRIIELKETMDVMMSMSTADVRRLRGQFTHALRVVEFVVLLQAGLRDRIHDEVVLAVLVFVWG